jgi:hypothetical protein
MSTVWDSRITNDADCTREIKSKIDIAKAAFNKKKTLLHQEIVLKFEEETNEFGL